MLKELIDSREQVQGEKITGESWLITNEKIGFATAPKNNANREREQGEGNKEQEDE